MPTLTKIAEKLGISQATVSNALSGKGRMKQETRELIIKEVENAGYNRHHTVKNDLKRVTILMEDGTSIFSSAILSGILGGTQEMDVFLPVFDLNVFGRNMPRNADTAMVRPLIIALLDQIPFCPSGMIYISQYPRKMPGLFEGLGFPVVAIQLLESGASIYINYDNQRGAYEAVQYMFQQGRRQIATLSGEIDTYSSSERMIGYQRALIDCSLPFHPKLIWVGDWSEAAGYHLTQKLLDMAEPPDAIFAQNDAMARGVINALGDKGLRIPQDMALIGFDNAEFAPYLTPSLSSMNPPRYEMGAEALKKMCALLKKEKTESLMLPCRLVLRESC